MRIAAALLLAIAGLIAGCGNGEDAGPDDQLVRLEIEGTLDFRMDETDGPEHIVELDEAVTIDDDGSGTRTSVSFEGEEGFEVSPPQLAELEEALAKLDLSKLEDLYAAEGEDDATTSLTYRGETIVLGERLSAVNPGEGELQHDLLGDVTALIGELGADAVPPAVKEASKESEAAVDEIRDEIRRARNSNP